MSLIDNAWQVPSLTLFIIIGVLLAVKLASVFRTGIRRSVILFLWHTLFTVIYCLYVLGSIGDSTMYYQTAKNLSVDFSLGTSAVQYLTALFTVPFNNSFLGTSIAFGNLGFIGLLALDGSLREVTRNSSKYLKSFASLFVFLPSISFWSASIGKDSLAFLASSLLLWTALRFRKRMILMLLAIGIMLLVRPHIAGLIVTALAVSLVFDRKLSTKQRSFSLLVSLILVGLMIPIALNYVGLSSESNTSEILSYIEERQSYNQVGGGSIDISSMSLFGQLFTYVFRPLPYEAHSLTSLAAALDNVILLTLFVFSIVKFASRSKAVIADNNVNGKLLWGYVILSWVILAMTTANLGIAVRQKWMFLGILVFLLIKRIADRK